MSSQAVGGESQLGEERTPVTISETVAAGATNSDQEYTVRGDGTIERFVVRIYEGAELDLELKPQVLMPGASQPVPLIDLEGKGHIDGDDDVYEWDLSRPVPEDSVIRIRATNQDGTNPYDYRANLEIEYVGGLRGRMTQLLGGIL